MHLLPIQNRSLDDEAPAVELDATPADLLVLSFADTDLAVAAAACACDRETLPSVRLIQLAQLKHPFTVDLFVERIASAAKVVMVRLLGGADYWRYGVDELAAAARRLGFTLALIPGDGRDDPRLTAASTLDATELATLAAYFDAGGRDNVRQALRFLVQRRRDSIEPPRPVPPAGIDQSACRDGAPGAPHALVVFYRSAFLAADTAPVTALADALAARGVAVTAFHVTSLKDPAAGTALSAWLDLHRPDVILNATAFAARDGGGALLDRADCPVLQVILAGSERDAWAASPRGLGPADLAMNVVLPEVDGRIAAGAVSFKTTEPSGPDQPFDRVMHGPDPAGIAHAADLALGWVALRRTPRCDRRLAIVVPDYPGKEGRGGYAVGLDTEASLRAMLDDLGDAGFDTGAGIDATPLMRRLADSAPAVWWSLAEYRHAFDALPAAFRDRVTGAWGEPSDDPDVGENGFPIRVLAVGKLVLSIQPDRGRTSQRRAEFHDPALPPRHGYVAFHLWLRHVACIHALVLLGTHGTLEWLPGKAVALGPDCAPRALVGAVPVITPFIVNNPGEAAQAKRRIGALTLGHLTPPMVDAGTHGETAELEQLFDEYAEALALDPRRARLIGRTILDLARERDLLPEPARAADPESALAALDNWLCDIKETRIGDGLHTFGRTCQVLCDPTSRPSGHHLSEGEKGAEPVAADLLDACGPAERAGLSRALDGRFVPPGPSGAPSRGRLDVLPTGRNLYSVDPRGVPTRTAAEIGVRMAEDLCTRYAQDHGDWPRSVMLDLWGSASMRTGGDDLAQAFALMGARPRWDHGSGRVSGFDILPLARLGRARVDVTLRISGLFRDAFPDQIRLFDAAVRAVADLDEEDADNPLATAHRQRASLIRVFGAAPGQYGVGVAEALTLDAESARDVLGATYIDASAHPFGAAAEPAPAADLFRDRVAAADAFSHTTDLPGQDVLESDTLAEHLGGFAAAAALLGTRPSLYHADASRPDVVRLRGLADAVTEALHARATNPRWITGQMRHGHRGAISLGETLDALCTLAATTTSVPSRHFDLYFDATLGDDTVRAFLRDANPAVARDMARRFATARANGWWQTRRNSVGMILADMCPDQHGRVPSSADSAGRIRAAPEVVT